MSENELEDEDEDEDELELERVADLVGERAVVFDGEMEDPTDYEDVVREIARVSEGELPLDRVRYDFDWGALEVVIGDRVRRLDLPGRMPDLKHLARELNEILAGRGSRFRVYEFTESGWGQEVGLVLADEDEASELECEGFLEDHEPDLFDPQIDGAEHGRAHRLQQRLESGELSAERVRAAAALGHTEAASLGLEPSDRVGVNLFDTFHACLDLLTHQELMLLTCDGIERVMCIEDEHGSSRPKEREVVELTREYALGRVRLKTLLTALLEIDARSLAGRTAEVARVPRRPNDKAPAATCSELLERAMCVTDEYPDEVDAQDELAWQAKRLTGYLLELIPIPPRKESVSLLPPWDPRQPRESAE